MSGDNVYLLWLDGSTANVNNNVFSRRSRDRGSVFDSVINLSNNPEGADLTQIAVSGSNVYVVWIKHIEPSPKPRDALFRRSLTNGSSFEPTRILSKKVSSAFDIQIDSNNIYFSGEQQMLFGPDGKIYVVWTEGDLTGDLDIFFKVFL